MVNDSAGTDVILVDKSQRPASAAGFKAAVAIETERGLCNNPTLITSTDDFVKVFGNPSFDKYGQANLEAYFLAQNNVPLVISRAKNQSLDPTKPAFACMKVTNKNGALNIDPNAGGFAIVTPSDKNTAMIYFKGEGRYPCKVIGNDGSNNSNVVVRFSKPATQSAYADAKRAFQLQVFDFAGARHIDMNTQGVMGITPNLEPVLGEADDRLALPGYTLGFDTGSGATRESTVTAFVNGVRCETTYTGESVYEAIEEAVKKVVPSFTSRGDGTFTVAPGAFNCFDLSISISISASARAVVNPEDPAHPADEKVHSAYYNYGCGSVSVTPDDDGEMGTVTFSIATGLYLENRKDYMYMGEENENWASYYSAYCKETYVASFNYNDYDPSYVSMQLDTVLAGSRYLVSRTSEEFENYAIDFADDLEDAYVAGGMSTEEAEAAAAENASRMVLDLQYFDAAGEVQPNTIEPGQRSYAYALALRQIMGNNLSVWRCVATPNLGDVINVPDFVGVIEAAHETTLGLSNIGKAGSLNAFENMGGRHGNRFIADFSQYGRKTVAGRRMWLTMAALMTLRLNINYRNGNEARPPMGLSYGQIQCDVLSETFTGPQRKMLVATYKLNPVIDENGFYAWEETTSQEADSSLSDIHVILSFCWMKYMLYPSMRPFVAEYNDPSTVNEGLRILKSLNRTFISRKYILEGKPNADNNIIGDKVMRFDFPVRFMGVSRYVDIYVTAYPQTQSLEISLAEEA